MDVYLLKDEPLMFVGPGKEVKQGLLKRSTPVEIEFVPVAETCDDAKDCCAALGNSLIENSQEIKYDWKEAVRIIPTMTVDLALGSSPTGPATFRLLSVETDPEWEGHSSNVSFLKRIFDVYGETLKLDVSLKVAGTMGENLERKIFVLEGKDLSIQEVELPVEYVETTGFEENAAGKEDSPQDVDIKSQALQKIVDYAEEEEDVGNKVDGNECHLDYCLEFTQMNVPQEVLAPWRQEQVTLHALITVTARLSHSAMNLLYLEETQKMGMVVVTRTMLEDNIYSDMFILENSGVKIKCHRAVLAAASQVFKKMLQIKAKSTKETDAHIKISDMSELGIRALLQFIYHSDLIKASQSCDIALELLCAGRKYEMPNLMSAMRLLICCKTSDWFNVDMVIKLFLFARDMTPEENENGKENLIEKVVHVLRWYMNNQSAEALASKEYQDLYKKKPQIAMELAGLFLKIH